MRKSSFYLFILLLFLAVITQLSAESCLDSCIRSKIVSSNSEVLDVDLTQIYESNADIFRRIRNSCIQFCASESPLKNSTRPQVFKNGRVTVRNQGVFIIRFFVSYDYKNESILHKSNDFSINQYRTHEIPYDAQNVKMQADVLVYIGIWETAYRKSLNAIDEICIILKGFTLDIQVANCY